MPTISERLFKIASFINMGERVADIGTDHGYLAIYLRQNGISPRVLACDINAGPLSVAENNVALAGVDGIAFRLSDGLEKIGPDEVDAAIIAGMGGELIASILSASWARESGKHFVLQPMNSPEFLREYLYKNGYTILHECAVSDAGRVYTIMDVLAKPDEIKRDEAFFFLGLLDNKNETDRLFLSKQYKRLKGCADDLEKTKNSERQAYYSFAAHAISDYLGV